MAIVDLMETPPRVSFLAISPHVFPYTMRLLRSRLPYLRTTDPTGLILVVFPPPLSSSSVSFDEGDVVVFTECSRPKNCLVLDVTFGTATSVYDPRGAVHTWVNLGVIAAPGGAPGFMLAEFNHQVGGDKALLTFNPDF